MASTPFLSHFGFVLAFWRILDGQNRDEIERAARPCQSRGPRWRLDPLLGPFWVILSHFGPFGAFFDPFWPFGCGAKAPSGSEPPRSWCKMGWGVKIGGSRGPKWRLDPLFGAIFGHFEPFLALLGPFWPFLVIWVRGKGSKWVRTPYSWGKMGRGVKIAGSRGPKCRLDPLFGGNFWSF